MSIYHWQDYILLNKDLVDITTEEKADHHWNTEGIFQMRLCNRYQLEVTNEFGNEVICYIPYYYYLYSKNLLFDNKITTYKGMECYYYFMNSENIIIKEDIRHWICPAQRPLLVNNNEHVNQFNSDFWLPPPYKSIFRNDIFLFEKPLLIIHNKYNKEWGLNPFNYINIDTLDILFNTLKEKYQIIYIRPQGGSIKNYSYDENQIIDEFGDYDLINTKYRDVVIPFIGLLEEYNSYTYNELLLRIYANCDNYICVQGGGSYLISYFFKKMVILHIRGPETEDGRNSYDGWFKEVYKEDTHELFICKNNESLLQQVDVFA
jgi:hypothetical protein